MTSRHQTEQGTKHIYMDCDNEKWLSPKALPKRQPSRNAILENDEPEGPSLLYPFDTTAESWNGRADPSGLK